MTSDFLQFCQISFNTLKIMIVLRQDQADLKYSIYEQWRNTIANVLAVLPTGGGKSVIVSDIVLDYYKMSSSVAVIAHRNELVGQMSEHLANRGIQHRIIASDKTIAEITRNHRKIYGKSFINPSAKIAVVGVDTLIARRDSLLSWASQIDLWVIDEAHHVLKNNKWGKAVEMFPRAYGLGVTATPCRADGAGLGREYDGVFDVMVQGLDMRSLIDLGALADYEIVCPESDLKLSEDEISASGDWSNKKLRTAAKKSHIIGDVVAAYIKNANGKKAICFATDVETAGEIADKFNANGIPAAAVSAKTNPAVREKYINDFKTGKILVLVNVDLFDEGFDVPACEVVIMARPTASLGKYRQMFGRGLRVAQGKEYGLVIDHVSNVLRHKLPDKHTEWTLARRDKRGKQEKDPEEIELRVCHFCTKPYERILTNCPYCGSAPPLPEPRDRSIPMIDGDLILLDRAKLAEMRKAIEFKGFAEIGNKVRYAAGANAAKGAMNDYERKITAHARLKAAIEQWAGIQRHKGLKDREIYKKFYLATNCDVLTALDASKSRAEFDALADKVEGWYK